MRIYPISEIDKMDFFWYLDLIIYKGKHAEEKRRVPIDQIF